MPSREESERERRRRAEIVRRQNEHPGRTPEEIERDSVVDHVLAKKQKLMREIDEASLDELRLYQLRQFVANPPPPVFIADPELMLDLVTGQGVA